MKLIHLSDLHLGKRVNEFSMLEEQQYILQRILEVVDAEQPDGVLIAGDVYDKSTPNTEAVTLLDDFLVQLSRRRCQVFLISGNHDSAERLAFGNRLMDASGVHICPVYDGKLHRVTLQDEYGDVEIAMLPFLRPANVRQFYPDATIESYTDAMRVALAEGELPAGGELTAEGEQFWNTMSAEGVSADVSSSNLRRVLITHQFITGASRSDSEEVSVGGADNVDASVFAGFDYVALGHLHVPQNVRFSVNAGDEDEGDAAENRAVLPLIRYCGTPLKYSFSEAKQAKSVSVVTLREKGDVELRTVPLVPKHDMVELRGTYEQLTDRSFYENTTYREDYVHITLTDEEDIPEALAKLRVIYTHLLRFDYDNTRTRHNESVAEGAETAERRSPSEVFAELFEGQNGAALSEEQSELLAKLIEQIWEEEA